MKKLVVISSYVATSRVGGAIAALIGPALDIDPVLIPTTLLGRHPGLGAPGGGAVAGLHHGLMMAAPPVCAAGCGAP